MLLWGETANTAICPDCGRSSGKHRRGCPRAAEAPAGRVLVRTYLRSEDYERDAALLIADGWRIASTVSRPVPLGCLGLLVGLFQPVTLLYPRPVQLVVTYTR